MRLSRRTAFPSGFTLLEMLVALSIMSIAIIGLLRVVVSNINATAEARDRTIAATLAQAKLHDIERDPEQQTTDNSGNFGEEHSRFSWTSSTQDTQWPELKRVTVNVFWLRGRTMKQMTFETLFRAPEQNAATSASETGAAASPTSPGATGGPSTTGRRP